MINPEEFNTLQRRVALLESKMEELLSLTETHPNTSEDGNDEVFDVRTTSDILSLHPSTIYRLIRRGVLKGGVHRGKLHVVGKSVEELING